MYIILTAMLNAVPTHQKPALASTSMTLLVLSKWLSDHLYKNSGSILKSIPLIISTSRKLNGMVHNAASSRMRMCLGMNRYITTIITYNHMPECIIGVSKTGKRCNIFFLTTHIVQCAQDTYPETCCKTWVLDSNDITRKDEHHHDGYCHKSMWLVSNILCDTFKAFQLAICYGYGTQRK